MDSKTSNQPRLQSLLRSRFLEKTHRALVAATLMLLGMTAVPTTALSQGIVTGQVTIASTGEPLPAASVVIRSTDRGSLTNGEGQFTIQGVPIGLQVIEASGLGYRAVVQTIEVVDGAPTSVDFELVSRPLELGGIQVEVLRPDLQPRAQLTEREVRRANPKDVGQLLRGLDGVDAVRRGPLGLDPVVRGLRETEVGTYLDGTRLFPAGPARMDSPLTHLDPSAVRNVEVVKGPYALTWGAGNLSAVRVETAPLPRAFEPEPRGSISAGYDTNLEASEVSGNYAGRAGIVSYMLLGAWREGSDYEAGAGQSIPGDFESSEGRAKIGIDVGDNSLLSVSSGYQDQGPLDYPGRLLKAEYFRARSLSAEWESTFDDGALRSLNVIAYRNVVDHGMSNNGKPTALPMEGRVPPFALLITVDTGIEVDGGSASAEIDAGEWSLKVGGDVYSANRDALRTVDRRDEGMKPPAFPLIDFMWPDATITDAGLYTRAARTLTSGIRLAGTVRMDLVQADADTISEFFRDEVLEPGQDLESSETNLSGALTVGLPVGANWDLSFGVGSVVRTADVTERFSDRIPATKAQTSAEFVGNPDLAPERSTQGDIWLEGTFDRTALQLNVFGRKVSDYITLETTDLPKRLPLSPDIVYRYINGDATFYGAEASVMYGLTDVLTAEVGGSYLWAEDDVLEEPVLGIAPARLNLGLRYEDLGGRYFLESTLSAVGRQERVATQRNEGVTPGYGVMDIRAGWAPFDGVNLRFGVENVLDKMYVNHLNARNPFTTMQIPEPGQVFFLDVSYGF